MLAGKQVVGEGVGVPVGVVVAVSVGVSVEVLVLAGVSVAVLVAVTVAVFVAVEVAVKTGVLVAVEVAVEVGVTVAVEVLETVGVEVGVKRATGLGETPIFLWQAPISRTANRRVDKNETRYFISSPERVINAGNGRSNNGGNSTTDRGKV